MEATFINGLATKSYLGETWENRSPRKNLLLEARRAGGVLLCWPQQTSEFVSQRQLYLSGPIEYGVPTSTGNPETPAQWIAIQLAEYVPVECVGDVHLKCDELRLCDGCPFDNGEILTHIAGAADVAEKYRQITKGKTACGNQAGSVGVEERSAIKEVVRTVCSESPIRVGRTPAVRAKWVEVRGVRADQGS